MKKLLISLVLIFFISISTMQAYAYYEDANTHYVTEEHRELLLTQKMVTEEGKRLVPKGSILGVDDTEEVVFEYKVFVQNGLELNVEESNLRFNGLKNEEVEALFDFSYDSKILNQDNLHTNLFEASEEGYFVQVTLTVSMNTPSVGQYQSIANTVFTFDVLFQST